MATKRKPSPQIRKKYVKKRRPTGRRPNKNQKVMKQWLVLGALSIFVILIIAGMFKSEEKVVEKPTNMTNRTYDARVAWINELAPYARELQKKYGVLASISIGQAILESNWNSSDLASQYHNLYGVKADANQRSVLLPTKEYENGEWVTINGRFAVYNSWQDSMHAHAKLLAHGTSWNPQQYAHVLSAKDYATAAKALTQDGYATDPTYAQKLIEIINTWHLNRFDRKT